MKKSSMKRGTVVAGIAIVGTLALTAGACDSGDSGGSSASKAQKTQNDLAGREATLFDSAVPYPYANAAPSNPLERQNLKRRLLEYNSSGDTNYVYLLNFQGEPIGYYVIKGKVSSTGSEMTSSDVNVRCGDNGTNSGDVECTNAAIGDDGTYGPEEGGQNGIFFYTAAGNLVETNDPFWVVSAQPIKLYKSAPQLDAK